MIKWRKLKFSSYVIRVYILPFGCFKALGFGNYKTCPRNKFWFGPLRKPFISAHGAVTKKQKKNTKKKKKKKYVVLYSLRSEHYLPRLKSPPKVFFFLFRVISRNALLTTFNSRSLSLAKSESPDSRSPVYCIENETWNLSFPLFLLSTYIILYITLWRWVWWVYIV